MLGTLIHYLRGTRIMMLQLSGFYYTKNQADDAAELEASAAIFLKADGSFRKVRGTFNLLRDLGFLYGFLIRDP